MILDASKSGQATDLPSTSANDQQTYHWLLWLHSKLKQDNTREFLIERMQPEWLEPQQKLLYHICVGLMSGLLIALIYGMSTGWIGATIGGVSYGLILAATQKIYPIETLEFSIEYAKKRFLP